MSTPDNTVFAHASEPTFGSRAAHGLTDTLARPLRDLRISVTDRCNFRCRYCMPKEIFGPGFAFLPRAELLTFEEIERLARLFVGFGVHKLRLTGGEPLLRRDLEHLVERLARIDGVDDIAMTTNGFLLNEAKARSLRDAGLGRVTISLDSLDPVTFGTLNGVGADPMRILDAIDHAKAAGLSPVKVNAVVQRSVNDADVVPLAERFRGTGIVLRFIEFMDVGTKNGWKMADVVTADEILERISARWPLLAVPAQERGEVARRYRYVDGAGEIGLIASVTHPFCGACSRARLSPEGEVFTCLFAGHGLSLRDPLRAGATDQELTDQISRLWSTRRDRYSEERSAQDPEVDRERVEMFRIGG